MNLEEILIFHFNMYPKMCPRDAVKLIYQNEFGGGHLIKSSEESFKYLIKELENTPANPSLPLSVPIGNGLVRINLPTLTEYRITPDRLNRAFVYSANKIIGSIDSFKKKLEILIRVTDKTKNAPFTLNELLKYLSEYEKAGYPMVSHSEEYRENYAPSYRIILENSLIPETR